MNLHFVFPPQNLHLTQFFLRALCLIFIPSPPDVRRTRFFLFVRSCIPPLQKCACPSLNAFQHTQLIQPLTSLYLPIYAYNRLLPPCVAKEKIGTLLLASETGSYSAESYCKAKFGIRRKIHRKVHRGLVTVSAFSECLFPLSPRIPSPLPATLCP